LGNTFGKLFCVTSFGESHGPAIGCIIDGCPAGLSLSENDIQIALDRRKPGQSHFTTQRRESDQVQILSGVYDGITTGAPIALQIQNTDQRASDYDDLKEVFRPGHGDYTYFKKYGHRDHRGGGRASARETALRVAAGAVAQKFLKEKANIMVRGYLAQLDTIGIEHDQFSWDHINQNAFFCPDLSKVDLMASRIEQARKEGDSLGARVNVQAENVPAGLGEPTFDRLDANLAKALMSIPAAKGVEIGDGFAVITQKGSFHRDEITPDGFTSNHAGGILAGISTGQPIIASVAFKPPSSIRIPADSIDKQGNAVKVVITGRHDPCVGIRAVPVVEAMVALVLMDHWLLCFGFQGVFNG
jgi:chorismate synthase